MVDEVDPDELHCCIDCLSIYDQEPDQCTQCNSYRIIPVITAIAIAGDVIDEAENESIMETVH